MNFKANARAFSINLFLIKTAIENARCFLILSFSFARGGVCDMKNKFCLDGKKVIACLLHSAAWEGKDFGDGNVWVLMEIFKFWRNFNEKKSSNL
jgi:hypothetical protein